MWGRLGGVGGGNIKGGGVEPGEIGPRQNDVEEARGRGMKAGMVERRKGGIASTGNGAAGRAGCRLEAMLDIRGEGISCVERKCLEGMTRGKA